jgi:ribosomal protein L2
MSRFPLIDHREDYIKKYKPITPGLRHKLLPISRTPIYVKYTPLSIINKKTGGRNHTGRITTRHIGGGHKNRTRIIDFSGNLGAYSTIRVLAISYDPCRNTRLALCTTELDKLF